jgi:hypothetical protein
MHAWHKKASPSRPQRAHTRHRVALLVPTRRETAKRSLSGVCGRGLGRRTVLYLLKGRLKSGTRGCDNMSDWELSIHGDVEKGILLCLFAIALVSRRFPLVPFNSLFFSYSGDQSIIYTPVTVAIRG